MLLAQIALLAQIVADRAQAAFLAQKPWSPPNTLCKRKSYRFSLAGNPGRHLLIGKMREDFLLQFPDQLAVVLCFCMVLLPTCERARRRGVVLANRPEFRVMRIATPDLELMPAEAAYDGRQIRHSA